jgi:molybdate transport system ATP-binding protein
MVAMAAPIGGAVVSVDIRKRFSSFELHIQHDFSAEFTVVFGPSGAGKSTLLDCIAGLLRPDEGTIQASGQIFFDSAQRISMPVQERRVGYVFQSLALFPHLSVEENAGYGLRDLPQEERRERVEKALTAFHIEKLRTRKPGELSGGEKQRSALARSLVTEPRLLLLDEPLTGLDAGLRRAILQDLHGWNTARRVPILYVTHNREEVDAIGERVITIENGRLEKSGAPRSVLDAPRSVALAQAAGFENLLDARVTEHREADGVMRVVLGGGGTELEVPLGTAQPGVGVKVAIRAGDILLASEEPRGLSARNVNRGIVESVEVRGSLVELGVRAGARFLVHVTPGAVRSLQLAVGKPVWLVVKTHSCHLVTPP